jgi:hypothetical protein
MAIFFLRMLFFLTTIYHTTGLQEKAISSPKIGENRAHNIGTSLSAWRFMYLLRKVVGKNC